MWYILCLHGFGGQMSTLIIFLFCCFSTFCFLFRTGSHCAALTGQTTPCSSVWTQKHRAVAVSVSVSAFASTGIKGMSYGTWGVFLHFIFVCGCVHASASGDLKTSLGSWFSYPMWEVRIELRSLGLTSNFICWAMFSTPYVLYCSPPYFLRQDFSVIL